MGSRLLTLCITALTLPISSLIGIGVRSPNRFTYTPAKAANTNASARQTIVRKPYKYELIIPLLRPAVELPKTPRNATPITWLSGTCVSVMHFDPLPNTGHDMMLEPGWV